MTGESEFLDWFRLLETPGVGRATARRLLAAAGSPGAVFDLPRNALASLAGAAVAEALRTPPPDFDARLATALAWWRAGPARHVITLGDPAFPSLLLQTADPPLLLYAEGDATLLQRPAVAVVGSRHCSPQGRENARAFARALGEAGWVVVSGLALGIDAAAHEGALDTAGGTVAVVGTGLDTVYPTRHRALAARIAERGLMLSEFPPGTPSRAEHFPQRNRLIAGLARGTLVVEAAVQSGSLITARLASEAGREVLAIPGSIHAPQARGCHALIKQGAKLVETAADVLDELAGPAGLSQGVQGQLPLAVDTDETGKRSQVGDACPVLDALGADPVTLDALQARTGWSAADLMARLMALELAGQAARLPGGLYQRLRLS